MNIYADRWTASKTDNELRISRLYSFSSREAADAFIRETGSYMSSPNISVLLEKTLLQNEVTATIQTRRDEFLLESVELISLEIERMYDQFATPKVEVPA